MVGDMPDRLTIVIPALNEEEAIGETIERCLATCDEIKEAAGLREVEIIVVSDGSSDRTVAIASAYPEASVLVFDENRGYGAAIKTGFHYGNGTLVSFLDADGTCDPRVFSDLCSAITRGGADLAIGSRMTAESHMPFVRKLGNYIFAFVLGLLSKSRVDDSASGMRVMRKDKLVDLYPLPDGLHFTPAMSARALLEGKLKVESIPMPYSERVGRSKLSVFRDGLRFFDTILKAALCYRPSRPLLLGGFLMVLLAVVSGWLPVYLWLTNGFFDEWLVYRVLLSSLSLSLSVLLVAGALVAERIASVGIGREVSKRGITALLFKVFSPVSRRVFVLFSMVFAAGLVYTGAVDFLSFGKVAMHWSRAVLASTLVTMASIVGLADILLIILELGINQRVDISAPPPPDRIVNPRSNSVKGTS